MTLRKISEALQATPSVASVEARQSGEGAAKCPPGENPLVDFYQSVKNESPPHDPQCVCHPLSGQ